MTIALPLRGAFDARPVIFRFHFGDLERAKDLRHFTRIRHVKRMEVCRQDPDHTNGPIVNLPRTADNGRSPPKRRFHSPWLRMMTSLRPGKASSGDEHAPELGWNAEHEEEVGTDALAAQHLGAAVLEQPATAPSLY